MAIGDVVNGLSAAALTFTPAVGVEVIVTSITSWNVGAIYLTDGVITNTIGETGTGTTAATANWNSKIWITNSIWITTQAGLIASFTGIQVK